MQLGAQQSIFLQIQVWVWGLGKGPIVKGGSLRTGARDGGLSETPPSLNSGLPILLMLPWKGSLWRGLRQMQGLVGELSAEIRHGVREDEE